VEGGVTHVTQIPRDSYLETERWGPIKVNALYSLGGEEEVKRELSSRMGTTIHHHMIVNLASLRQIADMLGGIEVDVPKRMYYVDNSQGLMIDLQPGRQILKGRDLEGFLRFRHDEAGDIGRPESLVRLPSLLMASGKQIRTDLGPMELGGLVTAMGSTRLETQRMAGRPFDRNGISYWDTDWPVQQGPGAEAGADGLAHSDGAAGEASRSEKPTFRYLF
jgi:LCP family protein required for cell wall assembly